MSSNDGADETVLSASAPVSASGDARALAAAHWALGLSAVWLVPLALVAAAIGYFGLLFVGFVGEGLGGGMPRRAVATVLGVPTGALVVAAALGLGLARLTARLAWRVVRLRGLPPWLLGLAAAVVGGAAGVAVFRIGLSAGVHLFAN